MHRSPVHVTPGGHDYLGANPWIEASDNSSSLGGETEAAPSATISIKRRVPSYHSRSHTTAGDPLRSPSVSSNEFPDVHGHRGASLDLDETRPSLKRAINRHRKTFEGEQPVDTSGGKQTIQAEAEVIVHQIQPGDSLPGVALRYNVSLATLRSVNKLWANDTIHLRRVLYIPIQAIATSKAKSIPNFPRARPEHPSHSFHSAPEVHTRTFPRMRRSPSDWNGNVDSGTTAVRTTSAGNIPNIKRVPLSELSFFPPPSSSTLSSPKHTTSRTRSHSPISLTRSDNDGTPPSTFPTLSTRGAPTFGLANFWNGAKDEIISRLSFDSTRGSSDVSEEHDLELDVVSPRAGVRHRHGSTDSDRDQELIPQPDGTAIPMHTVMEQESVILNTPRKSKMIRTVQLQPSSKMVIPASFDNYRTT